MAAKHKRIPNPAIRPKWRKPLNWLIVSEKKAMLVVTALVTSGCQSIAYTYNEPTIFYEYMLETAKLAKEKGMKNVIVSNGFINPAPLAELCKYIDGANIDLKSFNDEMYKKVCKARLEPVLNTLKTLKEKGVWLEVTNLIIPGVNDSMEEIERMCKWLKETLGNPVMHFSAFHPQYKMADKPPTPPDTLIKAREIAKKYLDFVYIGNMNIIEGNDTRCSNCREKLIERQGYHVKVLQTGKCKCGEKIPGVWK